jgi:CrcB protein
MIPPDDDSNAGGAGGPQPVEPDRRRRPRFAQARAAGAVYAAIAAGSVVGSLLRWLASLALAAMFGAGFPLGTLFVNVTGSFAIGFFAGLTAPDGRLLVGSRLRQFVMIGVCGGYTTFSAFSLETARFLSGGDLAAAAGYVGVSVTTWLAAVWLGDALAARLNRLKGA